MRQFAKPNVGERNKQTKTDPIDDIIRRNAAGGPGQQKSIDDIIKENAEVKSEPENEWKGLFDNPIWNWMNRGLVPPAETVKGDIRPAYSKYNWNPISAEEKIIRRPADEGDTAAGQVVSDLTTSPISLATMGGGRLATYAAAKGLPYAPKLFNVGSRIASGAFAAHGLGTAFSDEDIPLWQRGLGALEAIGGMYGMKDRLPKPVAAPVAKTADQLLAEKFAEARKTSPFASTNDILNKLDLKGIYPNRDEFIKKLQKTDGITEKMKNDLLKKYDSGVASAPEVLPDRPLLTQGSIPLKESPLPRTTISGYLPAKGETSTGLDINVPARSIEEIIGAGVKRPESEVARTWRLFDENKAAQTTSRFTQDVINSLPPRPEPVATVGQLGGKIRTTPWNFVADDAARPTGMFDRNKMYQEEASHVAQLGGRERPSWDFAADDARRAGVPNPESYESATGLGVNPTTGEVPSRDWMTEKGDIFSTVPNRLRPEAPNVARLKDAANRVKKMYSGLNPEGLPDLNERQQQFAKVIPRFIDALFENKGLRREQEAMYSEEKARRVAVAESITDTGQLGHIKKMGALKGEYEKLAGPGLKLDQKDVDDLFNIIENSDQYFFQKRNAATGLTKILGGQIPTDSELRLLTNAFGDSPQMKEMFGGLGVIPSKEALTEIMTLSKSLSSTLDFSMAFRQGLGAIHTREYWKSFSNLFKVSDKAFDGVMQYIHEHPDYEDAINHGLKITELGKTAKYAEMEEQFMSKLVGDLPGFKHSQRSAVAFLDKLRMDLYSRMLKDAEKTGEVIDTAFKAKLAEYVNTSTGRGKLLTRGVMGNMEKNAVMWNNMFFSPRLMSSRMKMLNPLTYINEKNTFIRRQYMKSALAIAGFGLTATGAAKVMQEGLYPNKEFSFSTDPSSSDFLKSKIGNTRFDPWGGHQQYLTATTRLLQELGELYNNGTGIANKQKYGQAGALDPLGTFTEQKLSPIASFVVTMLRGKDFQGAPADLREETVKRFIPMITQDLIEIYNEDPELFLPGAVGSAFGLGVQSYGDRHEQKPKLIDFMSNLIHRQ